MEIVVDGLSVRIFSIRGVQVMLDFDLAALYQIKTRPLNQTARRNANRLPDSCMFQITKDEFEVLMSQNVTSKNEDGRGGRKKLPLAFTDLGVVILSCILNNDRAVQLSIAAFRALKNRTVRSDANIEIEKRIGHLELKIVELYQNQRKSEAKFDSYFAQPPELLAEKSEGALRHEEKSSPVGIAAPERKEIEKIIEAVAQTFGLRSTDLKVDSRKQEIVLPRQIAMFLIRKRLRSKFDFIGRYFCKKDHSTVLYAHCKIKSAVEKDEKMKRAVEEIEHLLSRQI